jgi:hypothetical protein
VKRRGSSAQDVASAVFLLAAACGGPAPGEGGISAGPVSPPDAGRILDAGSGVASCPRRSLAWTDLGAVTLDQDGLSPDLLVPWAASPSGFAIHASVATGSCFQVDSLADSLGHAYVGAGDYGPFCTGCEQRSSAAVGSGLFVFPSNGRAFTPEGPLHLRLSLRDCATFGSFTPGARDAGVAGAVPGTVRVQTLALSPARASGNIHLRFLITPASVFHDPAADGDARLNEVVAELNARLASGHVTASISSICRSPAGGAESAEFHSGDFTNLAAVEASFRDQCAPDDGHSIPVILAGCLMLDDTFAHRASEVRGFTTHIPGGFGGNDGADGVFIKGSLCGTPIPTVMSWASASLGQLLAHELGHYLGLYHSVESDGSVDQLDDTDANNLMYYMSSLTTSAGLSPTQAAIALRHPLVDDCP